MLRIEGERGMKGEKKKSEGIGGRGVVNVGVRATDKVVWLPKKRRRKKRVLYE